MKIGICDNEKIFCNIIREYCEKMFYDMKLPCEVSIFSNGEELLESEKVFDIILLDIELSGKDGFQIAEKIRERQMNTFVIFVTGHEEMMKYAFRVRAFRFLGKPVVQEEIREALLAAIYDILKRQFILIQDDNTVIRLNYQDILYIESLGDGCVLHVKGKYYFTKNTLRYYTEKFFQPNFFRISRTHIVSLRHVVKLDECYVYLDTDEKFPVSRRRRKEFRKVYIEFCT